jgi:hypothetical protein
VMSAAGAIMNLHWAAMPQQWPYSAANNLGSITFVPHLCPCHNTSNLLPGYAIWTTVKLPGLSIQTAIATSHGSIRAHWTRCYYRRDLWHPCKTWRWPAIAWPIIVQKRCVYTPLLVPGLELSTTEKTWLKRRLLRWTSCIVSYKNMRTGLCPCKQDKKWTLLVLRKEC